MNTHNPYAAPRASDSYAPPAAGGKISIERAIGDAWRIATANIGVLVGGFLVFYIALVISAITIVVPIVLVWGFQKFLLNMSEGRADISDIFSGFKDFGGVLVSMLPYIGIQIGIAVVSIIVSLVPILGALVNLAASFAISALLAFALLLIIDRKMPAMDAIRTSVDTVKPQFWNVLGLVLLAGLITFAGVLALFIGLLFTAPLGELIKICAYRQAFATTPAGGGGGVRLDK